MKSNTSNARTRYNAGLVHEIIQMENNIGRKIDRYVYFIASAGHCLKYYIGNYIPHLKAGTLVIYILDVNDENKMECIFPITTTNCFDDVCKGNEDLLGHKISTNDLSRITKNELTVFTYTDHQRKYTSGGCEGFDYSNWYIYHNDTVRGKTLGYLPNISDNALVTVHFRILEESEHIDSLLNHDKYHINTYVPHLPHLSFSESECLEILANKYMEYKQLVDNVDIQDICNNFKLNIKTRYLTKIGGDDRMYINVERNQDERVDAFIGRFLQHSIEPLKESGYTNLYSCVDFGTLKNKVKQAEDECKDRLLRMYNPKEHLSYLLYNSLQQLILSSYLSVIESYRKVISIKEYRIWIAQHYITYPLPFHYHHIRNEEDIQIKVYNK